LRCLARVEETLLRREGLEAVPAEVLRSAAVQLDRFARPGASPGLIFLAQQMRREMAAQACRTAVERGAGAMNWRPTREASHPALCKRFFSGAEPEFETTVPMNRGGKNDALFCASYASTQTPHNRPTKA